MTGVSYHDTVNDLQGLNWSEDSPFARLGWFGMLETGAASPLFAMARDGENAVALPLRFADGQLAPLINWYAFTWSPLHTGTALDPALLQVLASALARRSNRIVLEKLPDDDGAASALASAFRAAGWCVLKEKCDVNHHLVLGGRSYETYLADRPGPLRTTLKRKAKKVDTAISTQFDEDDWAGYEAIYADSWKPEEGDPALLRCFAKQESEEGRYRFALARHDGEPVAAQFWTVDGDTAYIHKLAHRQSAQSLSPGTTLTAALMQHVIDVDGVREIDFGTGDDAYKRDWMEAVRRRYRLTMLRLSAPRNWPVATKSAIRKLVRRESAG